MMLIGEDRVLHFLSSIILNLVHCLCYHDLGNNGLPS